MHVSCSLGVSGNTGFGICMRGKGGIKTRKYAQRGDALTYAPLHVTTSKKRNA